MKPIFSAAAVIAILFCPCSTWAWSISTPQEIARLTAAAEKGDPKAQYELGYALNYGISTKIDAALAAEWWKKSADQNYAPAEVMLATIVMMDDPKSIEWLQKAVDQGDALAKFYLGMRYDYGSNGLAQDKDTAAKLYKEAISPLRAAAERGDGLAQTALGMAYSTGYGVEKDEKKGLEWWLKAAKQGFSEGEINVGLDYQNGTGVPKNDAEAVKWFQKAADHDEESAQQDLGVAYKEGKGIAKDGVKAYMWLDIALTQGNQAASGPKGALEGELTQAQLDEAKKLSHDWQEKHLAPPVVAAPLSPADSSTHEAKDLDTLFAASNRGDAKAQYQLGYDYHYGFGVKKNEANAVRLWRQSAEQGYAPAEVMLGVGAKVYQAEALRWLKKAVDQDSAEAKYWLALKYEYGYGGVSKDHEQAQKLWNESIGPLRADAEGHDAIAECLLGTIYENEWIGKKDDSESFKWHLKSAEQGYPPGEYALALQYRQGRGVPRNDAEAGKWLMKSAGHGYVIAQVVLATAYAKGLGIAEDNVKAYAWLTIAKVQGDFFVSAQLEEISKTLTPKQILEAKKMSTDWQAQHLADSSLEAQYTLTSVSNENSTSFSCGTDSDSSSRASQPMSFLAGVSERDKAHLVRLLGEARKGDSKAQFKLGEAYSSGVSLKIDSREGTKWLCKSAEQRYVLAEVYTPGNDTNQKRKWMQDAVDQGYAVAKFELAREYDYGTKGLPQDHEEAAKLYMESIAPIRIAAEHGDEDAQATLASAYIEGLGG